MFNSYDINIQLIGSNHNDLDIIIITDKREVWDMRNSYKKVTCYTQCGDYVKIISHAIIF